MNQKHHIPYPGQRIFRSMVAAWLCMAIYYLRGRDGLPFLSVIASLQCIQPYTETMRQMGKKRIIGTLVGAAWAPWYSIRSSFCWAMRDWKRWPTFS